MQQSLIEGFSKLSRERKIELAAEFSSEPVEFSAEMLSNWNTQGYTQLQSGDFTENAVSNFYLPYSLAPNFLIDGRDYVIPMVTEESSVVAAAAAAAKFWWSRGGFHTSVAGMVKPGHIHFIWKGDSLELEKFVSDITPGFYQSVENVQQAMKLRGGGITDIRLKSLNDRIPGYFQLEVLFNTVDAMGANFINSCLETIADHMIQQAREREISDRLEIIMSILSNYTPECRVICQVSCDIDQLDFSERGMKATEFVHRFEMAVEMATHDIYRAVTHNKGIYNGIDAVILATGNDFRAVEASGHAWASRSGRYSSLSSVNLHGNQFEFIVDVPMSVGVTGGMTRLHPMARASMILLRNPGAEQLMSVAASAGLANHFSAIKALITGGIQQGHMKLHLINILNQFNADSNEKKAVLRHFQNRNVTYESVRNYLSGIRAK